MELKIIIFTALCLIIIFSAEAETSMAQWELIMDKNISQSKLELFVGDLGSSGANDRFRSHYVVESKKVSTRQSPAAAVSKLAGSATQGMIFRTKERDDRHSATQIIQDSKGNIFATGANLIGNTINKITPEGVGSLVEFPMSSNIRSLAVDSKDNIYLNEDQKGYIGMSGGSGYSPLPDFLKDISRKKSYSRVGKLSPSGSFSTVISKTSELIYDITVDAEDNIYLAYSSEIVKVTPRTLLPNKTKVLVKYDIDPLSRSDREVEYKSANPKSMITDKENNLYFIESSYISERKKLMKYGGFSSGVKRGDGGGFHFEIKKITADGTISIVAGSDKRSGAVDGVGTLASFDSPINLSIDNRNNLYVLESKLNTIRRIDPNGNVTTIIGKSGEDVFIEGPLPGGLAKPLSITVRGNSLYIVMQNRIGVVRILPD